MSDLTPVAILALAAVGAVAVACLETLVAGLRPAPIGATRQALAGLREPISHPRTYDSWLFHLAPEVVGDDQRSPRPCAQDHSSAPSRQA